MSKKAAKATPPPAETPQTPPEAPPATETPPAAENAPEASQTPPAATPEPTTAEVQAGLDQFLNKMFDTPATETPEKPPETTSQETSTEEAPAEEEETEEEPPKETKKPAKPAEEEEETEEEAQPELDVAKIAEDAANRALERHTKPPETPQTPQTEGPKLSPARKRIADTLRHLEDTNPDYKGTNLIGQMQRLWDAEDVYKRQWVKENAGKPWDRTDEEHNEFFDRNDALVRYSEDDFDDAEASLAEKRENDREERHQREIQSLQTKQEMERASTEVERIAADSVAQMMAGADDAFKEALTVKGKLVVNDATMAKLEDANPVLADVLKRESERVQVMVTELEFASRFPDRVKLDPTYAAKTSDGQTFYPHRELIDFANALEKNLLAQPASKTAVDGKKLISQDSYFDQTSQIIAQKLPKADTQRKLQEFQNKYWCMDTPLVRHNLILAAGQKAKGEAARLTGLFEKRGNAGQSAPPNPATNGQSASAGSTQSGSGVRPPSVVSSGSEKTNALKAGAAPIMDRDQMIANKMWGG